jgi:glutamine synthetase
MRKQGMQLSLLVGSHVFNDKVMRERLPMPIYEELRKTIEKGQSLTHETANVVANAMKDWAVEKGATHFTHWFQPLTGMTAEKHDSFISLNQKGEITLEFTADMLTRGEPDASSFPSGGLRATFEARGYTIWDCTSPAFLKEDAVGDLTLYIPTAFCSYSGESLDNKTPLLRSMEAVSKQCKRLLHALGDTGVQSVKSSVGPEQEYFIIDKKHYDRRMDLKLCGRSLFGAPSPKGQELEDQYFGSIKDRIAEFMKHLDIELWKMGICATTKHNEVAPAQHELAVIYDSANVAADHNQLVMESLEKVALRHGLICLLHEKPFFGINGSGKHCNWSISTDRGENLLEPGSTPHENLQFLLIIAGLLKAIDRHADLLRASISNSGNDLRLGMHEAPPAIVSVFLGERLTEILLDMAEKKKTRSRDQHFLHMGVDTLPQLPRHDTDRNRTSPFAFTGNKFEFRMVASSASIACPIFTLNTIAAEAFEEIALRLEKVDPKEINKESEKIVREIVKEHGRVIFNGNGYSQEWVEEAAKRGLPNYPSIVDVLDVMIEPKSVKLFEKYKVLGKKELNAHYETLLDNYVKEVCIEVKTAIRMVKTLYLPAVMAYAGELAHTINLLNSSKVDAKTPRSFLDQIVAHLDAANEKVGKLEAALKKCEKISHLKEKSHFCHDTLRNQIDELRNNIDSLEKLHPANNWPVPSYADMLFDL